MMKNAALSLPVMLLLTGCAGLPALPTVATTAKAKSAASFCAVAEYQPVLPGDPVETQAQKASNNAKGAYLNCAWAK